MRFQLAAVLAPLLIAGVAAAADRPEGHWISANGNVEVEIKPCGPSLCGSVVRVMANRSMEAAAPSKAPPAAIGLRILSALSPSDSGQWTGKLFDRENGKTYDCVVTPQGKTMLVRPYVMAPIFGKTLIWTRAAS